MDYDAIEDPDNVLDPEDFKRRYPTEAAYLLARGRYTDSLPERHPHRRINFPGGEPGQTIRF